MTYPQHPFQQGFVQEHQHNQEEQPVPPHSTAATTSAPITIDKNANTTVEEKDGKMIVNDKRRPPIRETIPQERWEEEWLQKNLYHHNEHSHT